MPKSKTRMKKTPKRVLALLDLEHARTAVLNSLTSASGNPTYDYASSSPGTARSPGSRSTEQSYFDTGFTLSTAGMHLRRSIFGSPRCAASRTKLQTRVYSVPNLRQVSAA